MVQEGCGNASDSVHISGRKKPKGPGSVNTFLRVHQEASPSDPHLHLIGHPFGKGGWEMGFDGRVLWPL